MREFETPFISDDDESDRWYANKGMCGNRNVHDCLETVDRLLEAHGLELILYTGSSDYLFEIAKREVTEPEKPKKRYRGPEEIPVAGHRQTDD